MKQRHISKLTKKKNKPTLYLAYGSNMNIDQMKLRCPNAKPVGQHELEDHKLVFRGVADMIESEGDKCQVAIWLITADCEKALDRYEGYTTLYVKKYISIDVAGEEIEFMFYQMRDRDYLMSPSASYYQTIRKGYADFKMKESTLAKAYLDSRSYEYHFHDRQFLL